MDERCIKPDGYSYNSAILMCGRCGKWEMAQQLLREMPQRGLTPDGYTSSAIMSTFTGAGEWQRGLELLWEMGGYGEFAGLKPNVFTYNAGISACEKQEVGRWEVAVRLLREMEERDIKPDACSYNSCIVSCGKAGRWELSLQLLREMSDRDLKVCCVRRRAKPKVRIRTETAPSSRT